MAEEQPPVAAAPGSSFEAAMGALVRGLEGRVDDFEERSEFAMRQKLRNAVGEKTSKREVDRFLALMRECGNGSIAVAWRRYFDSDGDGELDFNEFCHALVELKYEGDVIRLWHDLSNPEEGDVLGLEDLDKESAAALDYFGWWCYAKFGGPSEFFGVIDDDGSDSLTTEEFAEGLSDLGFFECENIPVIIDTPYKVLCNLYPLLDSNGTGACSCEQLMFLEKDKERRQKVLKQLARIREFGKDSGGSEPLKSNAQKMLHKITMKNTPAGGAHWAQVTDPMAVGEPRSPTSPGGRNSPKSTMSASLRGKLGKQDSQKRLFRANSPGAANTTQDNGTASPKGAH